ncbi:MAG: NAD+ synthase [Candidatus Bathyarchaeia archaeon]
MPALDPESTIREVTGFIKTKVETTGAKGVVVGLSGGVDSSLVAALCVRALGPERVLGVLMPTSFTPPQDMEDAKTLAEQLGIRTRRVDIQRISEAFFDELGCKRGEERFRKPMANIRARCRMVVLYYFANLECLLVAGTGDRSETLIGYFTKYGDGGADIQPIAHLYKTQVRQLAEQLGVPKRIAYKPSSPQLYPGHKATDELPLSYEQLDPVLVGLFDKGLTPVEVSRLSGVPVHVVEHVLKMSENSRHKREPPPKVK